MYRNKKIGVVIPAYKEELLIVPTLESVPDFVDRVYAVNDASPDRTGSLIDSYAERDSRVVPIHHQKNKGVGGAIISGYKEALSDGMDIVAVMAGDNQMDPTFLPELLDPVVEGVVDYSVGNRLVNEKFRQGMSKWRFVGNSVLTLLTKIASGYWQLMDPQNGYTAISRRALETISLDEIYPGYGYCNDLLVWLNTFGFRVRNVPHPARYGLERSKIKYSTYIVRLSWLLLNAFIWRMKTKYIVLSFHPLVFFYCAGVFFTFISFLFGLYALWFKFIMNNSIFVPAVVSVIVFGIGVQFLLSAMMFDMQEENKGVWY
ncbi:glycosyl transferase, family 2 [Methanospirillum hungatei JF-1]|uniref:Glycosyl transferase, family 2 n=1 Tax=Methanospirillum hungatei JF-1 (strain ATCC 27890 / DSM 864 / NBRC 100397 / JF-1) TaxID=323259 RepID=Q2FNF3_METHJ|nr:glycosyltransferase family 2 protein [Methanospirillum hungatei]ABD42843.1 glycosyl transferase, family 2 [Methanospirillum hungatei JF-1]OQA60053.1 MAG: Glycosyltransferase AglD [Euryarchaeota archaeon ADurb.Bin294]